MRDWAPISQKSGIAVVITITVLRRQRWEDTWGLLTYQHAQSGGIQAQCKDPATKTNGIKHRERPLMSSYHLHMHTHACICAHIYTCKWTAHISLTHTTHTHTSFSLLLYISQKKCTVKPSLCLSSFKNVCWKPTMWLTFYMILGARE